MEHFLSGMILFDEHAPSSDVYIRNHQGHLLSLINKEAVLAQKIAPRHISSASLILKLRVACGHVIARCPVVEDATHK
jgi:hypothetical protein